MAIRSLTLSDTIGELVTEFNLQASDIGDMTLLSTSDTSSLVNAIASLDSDLRVSFSETTSVDSAGIIQLITDPSNLVSIFDSDDFQIVDERIALKDTSTRLEIVNDTTTNSTFYITFSDQTSGFKNDLNISSTKITFNPSTGILDVNNIEADSATIGNLAFTSMNGGNIEADSATFTSTVNAQDFNSTSDISLKENIETLNDAINVINRIRPVSFLWKEDGRGAYGVIAQEIEEVLPEIVDKDKNNIKRVAYSQLIPFLIQVIQEQHKEIQNIKAVLDLE